MARIYNTGVELVPGFRLVKLLGRGGFGEVWQASAPGGTDAAIKIINLGERYGYKELRAIRLVKQIRHPNLVPITAFWLLDANGKILDDMAGEQTLVRRAQELDLAIAMGLGDKSLLDRLRECQKEGKPGIPVEELLNYMEDAARAIDYLNQPIHDMGEGQGGIQHCDIKPQNILIVGGAAQVCDFGLARVLGDSRVTSAKGSAAYMAPELIADNKPSRSTDQYCLAISYVELRTGSVPVDVSAPAKAIWAHIQGNLDLSKLSPAEQEVIKRATSVKPEGRFDTTLEMVKALRQALMGGSPKGGSRIIKFDELVRPNSEIVPGYKLVRLLGKGGYGQVWEASAPGGKRVALKVIRNLEGVHGKQEFKALELIKGVDHNHLMELHAFWLLDRNGGIISDEERDRPDAPPPSILVIASKLANKNLLQRLHECQKDGQPAIPVEELLVYIRQAAQAIDYLNAPQHQLGDRKVSIQHRDIKPENILLAADVVKVGDFGLAKVVEGTSAVIHGDSAGLTVAYAAPEMFTSVVTAWSDQYCLAMTYFKLRTGGWPFAPESKPNEIIKSHVLGKLDLSRLPEAERTAIARATQLKPEQRFPTCLTMVEELERAVHGIQTGPTSISRPASSAPRQERHSATPADVSSSRSSSRSSSNPPGSASSGTLEPEPPPPSRAEFEETQTLPVDLQPADTSYPTPPPGSVVKPSAPLEERSTKSYPPTSPPLVPEPSSQPPPVSAESISERPSSKSPKPTLKVQRPKLPDAGRESHRESAQEDSAPLTQGVKSPSRPLTADQLQVGTSAADEVAPGDESQPASVARPRGGWKGTAPAPQPRRAFGCTVQVTLGAVLLLAGLGIVGYTMRDSLAGLLRTSTPTDASVADVQRLIKDQKYADALAKLDDAENSRLLTQEKAKSLREGLFSDWLKETKNELYEVRDYRRAEQMAAELQRYADNADVKKLREQAVLAVRISKESQEQHNYPKASLILRGDGRILDEKLRKSLQRSIVEAWLDQARKEWNEDKNEEGAARTVQALLTRFKTEEDAIEMRNSLRQNMLASAEKKLNDAELRLQAKKTAPDKETHKLLTQAEEGANKVLNIFNGRDVGQEDPDAYYILGRVYDLERKDLDAYGAYIAALPNPNEAKAPKLKILLGRLSFLLDSSPERRKYLKEIQAFHPLRFVAYADHAVDLSNEGGSSNDNKARALALSAQARILADKELDDAITRLKTAVKLAPRYRDCWLWRYELAKQLYARSKKHTGEERKRDLRDAIQHLEEAQADAPETENDQHILPLLEKLRKEK